MGFSATTSPGKRYWLKLLLGLLTLFPVAHAADVPLDQLVGWWRLDEAHGRVVADRSPSSNNLLLEEHASIDEQHGAPALHCDGLGTAGQIDEQTPLVARQALTLAIWVRADRHTREDPLFLRPNLNLTYSTPITGLYLSESCPTFGMSDGKDKLLLYGPKIALHQWVLVAVTVDGENVRLWMDGQQVAQAKQPIALPDSTATPWFVGRSQTRYFRGHIGEVMAWSRALSEVEMTTLYQATSNRYTPFNAIARPDPWSDRTKQVESPGNRNNSPWRSRATRTLEGLDGYQPTVPTEPDRYGGYKAGPSLAATGFFRAEKTNGRWWLVTPEGHHYWNVAINHVAPEGTSQSGKRKDFAEQATRDVRELGFNAIGTLSRPELRQVNHPLPYFLRLNFAATFAKEHNETYATPGHSGFTGDCVPVFHPDFPRWADQFAERLRATANDPLAIGIYTDNELQCSVDLLDRHLRLDPANPYLRHGREAALAWLRERNRPTDPSLLTLADRHEFIAHVFGTYSRIVHDAIRKHDSNHLIFGSRFFFDAGQFINPSFWAAVGPWIDVVAINYYGQWGINVAELEEWSAITNRPFVISEWYSMAMDAPGLANARGAGWLVRTQEDRGLFYQHFALSALECRGLVGIHYFKYMDDPNTTKALDAVGGANKGFYKTDGQPWLPLTERARAVNTAIYPLIDFFDARASLALQPRSPTASNKSVLTGAGPVVSGDIPRTGLVGSWRFDQASGRRVEDTSPRGNALRLERSAVIDEEEGVVSLRSDGLETGAALEENQPLAWKGAMTLAVWLRPERRTRGEPVVGRPHPDPNYSTPVAGLFLSELQPVFGLWGKEGKLVIAGPELPLRQWSLLVITLDGKTARLWSGDRLVAEAPQTASIPASFTAPWYVGRGQGPRFRGRIGEIHTWGRALTTEEVDRVYQATAPRYKTTPPLASLPAPDRMVVVESPGTKDDPPWRGRPTRTLEGLAGFTAGATPSLDRYGGSMDRAALQPTGYFRIERTGPRWWLVTPEGHPYWNMAMNTVRPALRADAGHNVAFAAAATEKLRALGFNGLGNNSLPEMREVPAPLPWCVRLDFAATFAREHGQTFFTAGHVGFTEECIPVFHPDFPEWSRHYAARLQPHATDPYVVGIFTDNELQCSVDLLDRHLQLDPTDPYLRHGRAAAEAWLKARERPLDPAQLTMDDRYAFIAHVFQTYSRVVHAAIRLHDQNHLILGSRFFVQTGQFDNPYFWPAVAPWMDVIAINYYGRWGAFTDELEEWSAAAGRPLMLTEWYSKAMDAPGLANTKGGGWLVRTQEDRGLYYQHFALSALECRALVGIHYFKYMDDPSTSKSLDAVGGANKGFYSTDGQPWLPLTERARAVNTALYPLINFFDTRRK